MCGQKTRSKMSKAAQRKEKQEWAVDKPKLGHARKLRGIYFIDPEEAEFKGTIKNARKKLEESMEPPVPCKIKCVQSQETCRKSDTHRSKHACIVEANESTKKRLERTQHKGQEDLIADKGDNSLCHYNFAHKFIPMPQAMKIREAKATVEKDWEKLEKMPAWHLTKVRTKKEVISKAHRKRKTIHFATWMNIVHLKNAELEPQFQKYKGRVVLRSDIVKDDSGSYAAFTEQGSSASQMTAAKEMDKDAKEKQQTQYQHKLK